MQKANFGIQGMTGNSCQAHVEKTVIDAEYEANRQNQFSRTELLIGKTGVETLKKAKVAVFGIGGVGSYVVEALCRAGVREFRADR